MTASNLTYTRFVDAQPLPVDFWGAGSIEPAGTSLDIPAEFLDGPIAVHSDKTLIAIIARSEDFAPYSIIARGTLARELNIKAIMIHPAADLTIRTEINPAKLGLLGGDDKPETDFLIVDLNNNLLVRLA